MVYQSTRCHFSADSKLLFAIDVVFYKNNAYNYNSSFLIATGL